MSRTAAALALLGAAALAAPAFGQSATPGGTLGLDLSPSAAQPDLTRVLDHVSPDMSELVEIATAMGQEHELRDVSGKTALVIKMQVQGLPQPLAVIVQTLGCQPAGCPVIQLQAAMGKSGLTEAEVGAWNAKSSLLFAVRVPDSGVIALRRPVLLAAGVTAGNLRAELELFTRETLRFIQAVQQKRQQAQ